MTDQQSDPALFNSLVEHEISSKKRKSNAGQFLSLKGWGGRVILISTAEHRETWSSQQDVFNVTSSVGTVGS